MREKKSLFVIAMVQLSEFHYKNTIERLKKSGPYRDTLRIEQIKKAGWSVYSLSKMERQTSDFFSDDHIEGTISKNQSEGRNLISIIKERLPITPSSKPFFSAVALEYIRMYSFYANQCYGIHFWSIIVPDLFIEGYISETTPIFVANFHLIEADFTKARSILAAHVEPKRIRYGKQQKKFPQF